MQMEREANETEAESWGAEGKERLSVEVSSTTKRRQEVGGGLLLLLLRLLILRSPLSVILSFSRCLCPIIRLSLLSLLFFLALSLSPLSSRSLFISAVSPVCCLLSIHLSCWLHASFFLPRKKKKPRNSKAASAPSR